MGMLACYMEAAHDVIENLKSKSDEDLFEEMEELEGQNITIYDMDKLWDGLHFILTGVSAIEQIEARFYTCEEAASVENNLLSEAVVGTAVFSNDKSADFISYIYPERVAEIASALNAFDINNALIDFSPRKLAQNKVYPTIWVESEKDNLKKELITEFNGLKDFFHKMSNIHKGIIVSIY